MSSAQPKKASRGGPPAVRSSGTEPPAGGVATIVDVARAAGVSISTVSRVLNANTQVDPRMAAKVIRAAQDLKYQPSRVARSLRLRHNRVWAMVISYGPDPSSPTLCEGSRTWLMRVATRCSFAMLTRTR